MVMSSAAGLPLSHPTMKMSAVLAGVIKVSSEAIAFLQSNTQVGTTARSKISSLKRLRRITTSPQRHGRTQPLGKGGVGEIL